jgi:autophagy-related protein 16-1
MLSLKEEREKLNLTLDSTQRELEALRSRVTECEEDIKDKAKLNKELKSINELLTRKCDELTSKIDSIIKENEKLQHENNELLERMLKLKEEQISQMNQLNEYYEALIQKEQALEKLKSSNYQTFDGSMQMNSKPVKVPTRATHKLMAHNVECTSVAYNDGGSIIVTSGSDVYLKVWDSNTGTEKTTLRGLAHSAMDVSICPGSELIMAGCTDNIAYVWNYNTGRIKHNLTGHANKICTTSFFNNKNHAVTGSHDRTIKVWDVVKGFCTKTIPCISSCFGVSLTPEDSILASCHHDGHVRLWSPKSGELIQDVSLSSVPFTSCAVSPNNYFVACSGKDDKISILDLRTFKKFSSLQHHNYACSGNYSKIAWSFDSGFVVAGGQRGQLFVWNANTSGIEEILDRGHTNPVVAVTWRPRESHMASVDSVGGLVIWN